MNAFHAARHHYEKNHRESIAANVRPAIIETPGGGKEAGVMIGNRSRVLVVLTAADAYRIAKDIANILTAQKAANK